MAALLNNTNKVNPIVSQQNPTDETAEQHFVQGTWNGIHHPIPSSRNHRFIPIGETVPHQYPFARLDYTSPVTHNLDKTKFTVNLSKVSPDDLKKRVVHVWAEMSGIQADKFEHEAWRVLHIKLPEILPELYQKKADDHKG